MNNIEKTIKKACAMLKNEKASDVKRPSEEELACFSAGLLDDARKQKILDFIALYGDEEEALKGLVMSHEDGAVHMETDAPHVLAERVKSFMPSPAGIDMLDAVIEFTEDMARVIRTTGTILTRAIQRDMIAEVIFRDAETAEVAEKAVEIFKTIHNNIVDVKIAEVKGELFRIVVHVKDNNRKRPLLDRRISLVCGDREIISSLTKEGKVEFESIEPADYRIYLIYKGESSCIATLSLKSIKK